MNLDSSENPRNISNVSGFDEYSASEKHRMTLINGSKSPGHNNSGGLGQSNENIMRGSTFHTSNNNRDNNEFARLTVSSSSTNRDDVSECESSSDPRDSLRSRNAYIRTAHFKGTGQNG